MNYSRLGLTSAAALAIIYACAQIPESVQTSPAVEAKKLPAKSFDSDIDDNAKRMFEEGRKIFRYDTFGSEAFWGDKLRLHEAIAGSKLGGVGPGLPAKQALELGLKVDAGALPKILVEAIKGGSISLEKPETTLELLRANAVVGVTGFFDKDGRLRRMGIQCAICHSTVDNSLARGIGRRLDGWPNRDLNIGAIVALAPTLKPFAELLGIDEGAVRQVLMGWGPGKFDAELNLDGKGVRPDGASAATLIPPAFGLAGVNLHTWTGGWGTVSYWNAFVVNLEMQGQGVFFDARLNNSEQYPVAAKAGFGNKRSSPDMVTAKLSALHFYQLAIPPPTAPPDSFNKDIATRGKAIFEGKARCATCHVPPLFTEPGWNTHRAADIGIDDFQANRSPDKSYRTAPLRGLWSHQRGGFYHDGRFPTLLNVVDHYDRFLRLGLTPQEKIDLIEYLKSL